MVDGLSPILLGSRKIGGSTYTYMEDQLSISTIPANRILLWWASEPSGQDYKHVTSMARTQGIRISEDQARRHVGKLLRQKRLLPVGRKASSKDFAVAKQQFLAGWFDQPIF